MDSNLSSLYRVMSRNVSSVSLISCVNLIVGWIWLMFDVYFLRLSVVPVHIMKILSMNLFQVWVNSDARLISCVSNLPVNRFA